MSNSRLEKFIYAICSMEVSDLPAPLSRIEILWNCLITGETPDFESQSRNEQYLMAMLGLYELENLPTPMSRGEKLLYKIAMGETDLSDIPAYLSRYEELLGYLAENGGVGDFEYILQTLNQRLSTLYSTKERPMKQAVIKGDTLVNELPRPSLKNTMTNAASQKLNQGYDNGKTLVNVLTIRSHITADGVRNNISSSSLKGNTKYIFLANVPTNDNNQYNFKYVYGDGTRGNDFSIVKRNNTGRIDTIFTTPDRNDIVNLDSYKVNNNSIMVNDMMLIEYQDGMENWDIPYFEGTKTFSATPNVVDGEFKQAVVKGQTLVNLINSDISSKTISINTDGGRTMFEVPYAYSLSVGKTYTVIFETENFIGDEKTYINFSYCQGRLSTKEYAIKTIENKIKTSFVVDNLYKDVVNKCVFYFTGGNTPSVYSSITIKNVMIIEGDHTNTDIPYFEGMQSVQLSGVTTTGKNLFDGKNMSFGYYRADGVIDDFNHENSLSDYIKVEPSSSYAYKCFSEDLGSNYGEFAFFDENKNFINVLHAHHTSDTCIITPDNCHYLRAWNNQYINNGESHPNAMLVKTTDLPSTLIYEPYKSNTLTLAEPVNLRKVGDVEDEFDALTGQVTENLIEVSVNSSIRLSGGPQPISSHTNTSRYTIRINDTYGVNVENNYGLSDKIPCKNNDYDDFHFKIGQQKNTCFIYVPKNELETDDWDGFVKWANNKDFKMVLKRSTNLTKTINTTITDHNNQPQTKLHSFNDGHLSVSSQGLLPSAVNYEVPTNNSYYLPDMLTLGAQYTSRGSADCNATINGKLLALGKNRTFTTPNSVTNRLMVLDAPVDDLMFIKGDQTAKDFGYFEGMKSVVLSNKMPVLTTSNEDGTKTNILTVNEDVGLRGIGDVRDELNCLTGELTENFEPFTLNGSENWKLSSDTFENTTRFILNNYASGKVINQNIGITNTYEWGNYDKDKPGIMITKPNGHAYLRTPKMSVDELKTMLSNNPIHGYYNKEKSIKTVDLTAVDQDGQPTKLKTFNDITHIEIKADNLIPSVDLEVATKISETLSTMGPQQIDISNTQNQLGQTIEEQSENTDATMMATTEIYEQTL